MEDYKTLYFEIYEFPQCPTDNLNKILKPTRQNLIWQFNNMIDKVLNNEKSKEEKQTGGISIKEKLAEKKAVTWQRGKSEKEAPEKGTEKKSEREI